MFQNGGSSKISIFLSILFDFFIFLRIFSCICFFDFSVCFLLLFYLFFPFFYFFFIISIFLKNFCGVLFLTPTNNLWKVGSIFSRCSRHPIIALTPRRSGIGFWSWFLEKVELFWWKI